MIEPHAVDPPDANRASPTVEGLIELLRAVARQAPVVWALPLSERERALLRFCAARAVEGLRATALAQDGAGG